jgi:hypothetical protein
MKTTIRSLGWVMLGIGLFIGCAKKPPAAAWSFDKSEASAPLKAFVAEKEAQANAVAKAEGGDMLPEFKSLFAAAGKGDWLTVSNIFADLHNHAPQYEHSGVSDPRLRGSQWQALIETEGALEQFANGDEKYEIAFGHDIIQSIPPGSIYFGGTDPGRFLVTALQKSQVNGDPFFTLTQNALADATYLQYLSSMYGGKIYTPTSEDLQRCFQDYVQDAQQRLKQGQLKPGEDVRQVNGHVQVSGQVAVMEINGLMVKIIFDKNPDREFFVEESFPLDWMYPHLEPHGLIFKLNRQPLPELSDEIVRRDHDYWTNCIAPMIGDWLNYDTTIKEIAAFAEKVYARQDFGGFTGDPRFVWNAYSHSTFSKERCAIAELYAWRAEHTDSESERKRMQNEADFAFRQGWALCPASVAAIYRYVNLLLSENRVSDAILVVETALKMPQMNDHDASQVRVLLKQLEQMQKQQLVK